MIHNYQTAFITFATQMRLGKAQGEGRPAAGLMEGGLSKFQTAVVLNLDSCLSMHLLRLEICFFLNSPFQIKT